MFNYKVLPIALLALAVAAPQAFADWQYTKWGSSLADLKSIPEHPVVATTPKEQRGGAYPFGVPMAKTTYSALGTTFDVNFLFAEDKLNGVVLYMNDLETASRIGTALGDQYGKPVKDTSDYDTLTDCQTIYRSWRDDAGGNVVSFRSYACVDPGAISSFHLMYRPILTKAKTGL